MKEEVQIQKAVLHILDNNIDIPVLSQYELDLTYKDIQIFLEKHILKAICDNDIKNAQFINSGNSIFELCKHLATDLDQFLKISWNMANSLFAIMIKNIDIPAADLICCVFLYNDIFHFGLLKLNYKSGFIHHVQNTDQGSSNFIIKQRTLLPSETNKIEECVFINLSDYSLRIIEKQYEINGENTNYLSKIFLKCDSDLSNNEKVKILDRVTQRINKKYFDEDFDKTAQAKKVIAESIEETNTVEINYLAEEVFPGNLEVQQEYVTEIKKAGIMDATVTIPDDIANKRFKNQKIKTDTGIEINFPASYYNNKEKIEFLNNPDGTLSILIKNVGKITNR